MDILERRLLAARGSSAAPGGAGAGAEGGELGLALEGVGRAPLTGRDRIRRDRDLHRLKLLVVADMPRDVLVDLVQVRGPSATYFCTATLFCYRAFLELLMVADVLGTCWHTWCRCKGKLSYRISYMLSYLLGSIGSYPT